MTPELWAAMTTRVEQVEMRLGDIHAEQSRLMAERTALLERLTNAIGERSPDGKGGTGLFGEITRLQKDMAELIALKNQGIGLIVAVSIFGVLIVLGIRHWIGDIIAPRP